MSEEKEEKNEIGNHGDELEKCLKEKDEYLEGWKRAKADFANYKKSEKERMEEAVMFANKSIIKDLLAVIDSFELSLSVLEKKNPVEKGVRMIKNQLEDALRRYGLEKIKVSPGDRFDTSFCEALGEIESGHPENTIAEEIESGYRLHNKVIRPARVNISKGQKGKNN